MYWGRGTKQNVLDYRILGMQKGEKKEIDWYRNIPRGMTERYV